MSYKVYVGSLGNNVDEQGLHDAFKRYGTVRRVWVARRPAGFAFVEFDRKRNAHNAAESMDGRLLHGHRMRCEISRKKSHWPTRSTVVDIKAKDRTTNNHTEIHKRKCLKNVENDIERYARPGDKTARDGDRKCFRKLLYLLNCVYIATIYLVKLLILIRIKN